VWRDRVCACDFMCCRANLLVARRLHLDRNSSLMSHDGSMLAILSKRLPRRVTRQGIQHPSLEMSLHCCITTYGVTIRLSSAKNTRLSKCENLDTLVTTVQVANLEMASSEWKSSSCTSQATWVVEGLFEKYIVVLLTVSLD
jgi:hypothetical protein